MSVLTENSTLNVTSEELELNLNDFRIIENEIPKIKIDENSLGVILFLPEQKIKKASGEYIEWQIIYNDNYEDTQVVKSELFENKDIYISRETSIILSPAEKYSVNLYIDNNKICSWNYEGITNTKKYICFDFEKNLINNKMLPRDESIIAFKSEYILNKENIVNFEIDGFMNWKGYRFYRIDPKNSKNVYLKKFDRLFKIPVEDNAKPRIIGGEKLFGIYNESKNYIELPYIKLYQTSNMNDYRISVSDNSNIITVTKNLKDIRVARKGNYTIFPLCDEFIKDEDYGVYTIIIHYNDEIVLKEDIIYSPDFDVNVVNENMWPVNILGYNFNSIITEKVKNLRLDFTNADLKKSDENNQNEYKINNNNDCVIGEAYLENKDIKFEFKKNLKPVLWQWMDTDKSEIKWDSKCKKISYFDLKASSYILFSASHSYCTHLKITVKLKDIKKKLCNEFKFKIYNGKVSKLYVNIFQNIIQRLKEKAFYIDMEVKDSKNNILSECSLAVVQEKINTYNYSLALDNDDLVVFWNEDGSKADRKMLLYDIYNPFKMPNIYDIKDGECEFRIDSFKSQFTKGRYGINILKAEDCTEIDSKKDIISLKKLKKVFNYKKGSELIARKEDLFVTKLISYFFKEDVNIQKYVKEFNDIYNKDIIYKLSYMYIYVLNNCNIERRIEVEKIFKALFSKFSNVDKYYILKELVKLDLNKKNFEILITKWNILSLPVSDKCMFSIHEREYMWNNMPLMGFIADMRSIPIDKKGAAKKIVNWIENLEDLILCNGDRFESSEKLITYLENNFWDYNNGLSIKIDRELLGSNEDINKYFEYEYSNLPNKRSTKKEEDLYSIYFKSGMDNGNKIFNKTYLEKYLNWNKKVIKEKRDLIEMRLNDSINKSEFKKDFEKCRLSIDNSILNDIKLRSDIQNRKYEYCGMVFYLNSIFTKKNYVSKNLSDLVSYIYKRLDLLAVRDIVIFEFNRKLKV
jgi:hypothetical protein